MYCDSESGTPRRTGVLGFLGSFKRSRSGSALIEFALAGPMMLTAIIGTMEIGMVLTVRALMEGAVRDAARFGVTGQSDAERLTIIGDIIESRTIGLVKMDEATVDILTYGDFEDIGAPEPFVDGPPYNGVYDAGESYTDINSNGQWDPDQGKKTAGGASQVVLYRIFYKPPTLTGLFDDLFGKVSLTASIAVRNEPWDVDT